MTARAIENLTCPRCGNSVPVLVWRVVELPKEWQAIPQLIGGQANQARCGRCGTSLQVARPLLILDRTTPQIVALIERLPKQVEPRAFLEQQIAALPPPQRQAFAGARRTIVAQRAGLWSHLSKAHNDNMQRQRKNVQPLLAKLLEGFERSQLDPQALANLLALNDLGLEALFAEMAARIRRLPANAPAARGLRLTASQWAYLRVSPFEVVPLAQGAQSGFRRLGRRFHRDFSAALVAVQIPPDHRAILLRLIDHTWGGGAVQYLAEVFEQLGPDFFDSLDTVRDEFAHQSRADLEIVGESLSNMLREQLPLAIANKLLKAILNSIEDETIPLGDVTMLPFALPGVPEQLRFYGQVLTGASAPGNPSKRLLSPELAGPAQQRVEKVAGRLEQLIPVKKAMDVFEQRSRISSWQLDPEQHAALMLKEHLLYSPEFFAWLRQLVAFTREQGLSFEADTLEIEILIQESVANLDTADVEQMAGEMPALSPEEKLYRGLVGKAIRAQTRDMYLIAIDHPAFDSKTIKRLLDRRRLERLNNQPLNDKAWEYFRGNVSTFAESYEQIELARQLIALHRRDRAALRRDLSHPRRWEALAGKLIGLLTFSAQHKLHPLIDRLDEALQMASELIPDPATRALVLYLYGLNLASTKQLHRAVELLRASLSHLPTDGTWLPLYLTALSTFANLAIQTGQTEGWGEQIATLTRMASGLEGPEGEMLRAQVFVAHLQARMGLVPLSEARALQPMDVMGTLASTPDLDYEGTKALLNQTNPYEHPGLRMQLLNSLIASARQQGKIADAHIFAAMMMGLGDSVEIPLISYSGRMHLAETRYLDGSEFKLVVEALEDAQSWARDLALVDAEVRLPLTLGRVYADHGDLERALAKVQPVFERLTAEPEQIRVGYLIGSATLLAELHDLAGDREKAEAVLQVAKELCPETNQVIYGEWHHLDLALQRAAWSTQPEELRKIIARTRALIANLPGIEDQPEVANLWLQQGRTQLRLARLEADPPAANQARSEALETFRRLVDHSRRKGNQRGLLAGLAGLAQSLEGTSAREQAELLGELRDLYDRPDALPAPTWLASLAVARLYRQAGNPGAAVLAYERAVQALERLGGSFQREEAIQRFFQDKIDVYGELISAALLDGRLMDAFHYSERAKSKALVRILTSKSYDPEVARSGDSPLREVGALEAEEVSQILGQIDQLADGSSALVEWFLAGRRLHAFLLTRQGMQTLAWDIDPQRCRAIAERPTRELDYDDLGFLYTALWEPLAGALAKHGVMTICAVPHGVLHRLPLAAAWDSERKEPIGERYVIAHCPTARILALCLQRWHTVRQRKGPVLLVPDPQEKSLFDYPQQEVEGIAELYTDRSPTIFKAATRSEFLRQAGEASLIHFAGHAVFDMKQPMDSGLIMRDGTLTAARIMQELKAQSRLITLSACATSRAEVTHGEACGR